MKQSDFGNQGEDAVHNSLQFSQMMENASPTDRDLFVSPIGDASHDELAYSIPNPLHCFPIPQNGVLSHQIMSSVPTSLNYMQLPVSDFSNVARPPTYSSSVNAQNLQPSPCLDSAPLNTIQRLIFQQNDLSCSTDQVLAGHSSQFRASNMSPKGTTPTSRDHCEDETNIKFGSDAPGEPPKKRGKWIDEEQINTELSVKGFDSVRYSNPVLENISNINRLSYCSQDTIKEKNYSLTDDRNSAEVEVRRYGGSKNTSIRTVSDEIGRETSIARETTYLRRQLNDIVAQWQSRKVCGNLKYVKSDMEYLTSYSTRIKNVSIEIGSDQVRLKKKYGALSAEKKFLEEMKSGQC